MLSAGESKRGQVQRNRYDVETVQLITSVCFTTPTPGLESKSLRVSRVEAESERVDYERGQVTRGSARVNFPQGAGVAHVNALIIIDHAASDPVGHSR